ncbi:hypothetical protein [Nisaea sediminum]|uniref:hypothetical protein n=1 Tax=Nisaea sediminum TaxID=2775867 RepID=UPI001869497E|nr:hypothetical protein [Nisaea sediminum]
MTSIKSSHIAQEKKHILFVVIVLIIVFAGTEALANNFQERYEAGNLEFHVKKMEIKPRKILKQKIRCNDRSVAPTVVNLGIHKKYETNLTKEKVLKFSQALEVKAEQFPISVALSVLAESAKKENWKSVDEMQYSSITTETISPMLCVHQYVHANLEYQTTEISSKESWLFYENTTDFSIKKIVGAWLSKDYEYDESCHYSCAIQETQGKVTDQNGNHIMVAIKNSANAFIHPLYRNKSLEIISWKKYKIPDSILTEFNHQ